MPSGSHRSSPGSHSTRSYSSRSTGNNTSVVPIFMMNRYYRRNGSTNSPEHEELRKHPLIRLFSTIFSIMIILLLLGLIQALHRVTYIL